MYLQGSLLVLQPLFPVLNEISDSYMLYLSSFLISNFIIMEAKIPKLISLTQVKGNQPPLPPEILSQILRSTRISKDLSDITTYNKCIDDPVTLKELSFTGEGINTFFFDGIYFSDWFDEENIFHLSVLDTKTPISLYHLSKTEAHNKHNELMNEIGDGTIFPVEYSLYVYKIVYKNRNCPVNKSIISMLSKLLYKEVDATNFSQVCAWLVQLCVDTGYLLNGVFETYEEIDIAFKKLLKMAIQMVSANTK
jgi:hypothetical protein